VLIAPLVVAWLAQALRAREAREHEARVSRPILRALEHLRTAQFVFRETDREDDGRADYGSLQELAEAGLIDPILGEGIKERYQFTAALEVDPAQGWTVVAVPQHFGSWGSRAFASDESGTIWFTTAEPDAEAV